MVRWHRGSLRQDDEPAGDTALTRILPRPRSQPDDPTTPLGPSYASADSAQQWGDPAMPWPGVFGDEPPHQGAAHTQALDPVLASASADPFRDTVVVHPPAPPSATDSADPPDPAAVPPPLLSRRRAAELGMYAGAGIVVVALLGIVLRQWPDWSDQLQLGTTGLASVALVCGGLFLRLPWDRRMSQERTRAVSAALSCGVATAAVGVAALLGIRQSSDPVGAIGHALLCVLGLALVCVAAATAFSETLLLVALCWLAWVALPSGTVLHLGLACLGSAWVVAGRQWARGPRTAAVIGTLVALVGGTLLAAAPDAWIARGVLAVLAAWALWAFLSGAVSAWLGLAAGAACALSAGIVADLLSPAPALLAGGLATMAVSAVALRGARDECPDVNAQSRSEGLDSWAI